MNIHKSSYMNINHSNISFMIILLIILLILVHHNSITAMNVNNEMLNTRNVAILITNFDKNNNICQCNYESISKYAKLHRYLLETHDTNNYFIKLKDLLTDEKKKYLVLTLNCDIIVKNYRIKVEYLWEDYATSSYNSNSINKSNKNIDNINTSMIISRNVHWSAPSKIPFNVASIVWNYNQWTDSLIHNIISYNYNNTSSVLLLEEEGYVDQLALNDILLQKIGYISNNTWVSRKRRKPEKRIHDNIKVLGPGKMIGAASSDAGLDFGIPKETYWHEGDWLLQIERPACCESGRLKEMQRFNVCPKLMQKQQTYNHNIDIEKNITSLSIVVLHTNNATHCNCAQESVERYASKHDYYYHLVTGRSKRRIPMLKHVKFEKYVLVRELLMYKSPLVLLLDCDVAVTNHSIIALDLWKNHTTSTTNILVARDAWWQKGYIPINTGVVFFKNSTWTHNFLKDVIRKGELSSKSTAFGSSGDLKDQPRFTQELLNRKEMILQSNNSHLHFEHVEVVSQRVMNSFKRRGQMYKFDQLDTRWRKRDWLLHATGSSTKARYNMMKDKGICPIFKHHKEANEIHDSNSNGKDIENDD